MWYIGKGAVVAVLVTSLCGPAIANGFGENRPWQFATPGERNARASTLDLMERKKGGYYDGFGTEVFNENYNCTGNAPSALANESVQLAEAQTSSPETGSTAETDSRATGNEADTENTVHTTGNRSGRGKNRDSQSHAQAPLNTSSNSQTNEGNVNSAANSSVDNRVGDIDASGGESNQAQNSDQVNSGTVLADGSGNVGCNFYSKSGGKS